MPSNYTFWIHNYQQETSLDFTHNEIDPLRLLHQQHFLGDDLRRGYETIEIHTTRKF